jgi:parvulin-like peptidyl-prolyl isomerase
MKVSPKVLLLVPLLISFRCEATDTPVSESEILAQRGKGVITYQMFAARADKIPANIRQPTLRDRNRLQDVLSSMLLRTQLAADAREAGFDKEPIVIDRMQLAADYELAEAWLQHYVESQPDADYEQLAHEYFLLNQAMMVSSPKYDVSHILISNKDRSDEEAEAIAEDVYQQLLTNPELFGELVVKYSEDPSAGSNHGSFSGVKKGTMVKPFEDAALALQPGELTGPVKTEFGYHIIRLDAYNEPKSLEFDDVKAGLIDAERKKHEERVKLDYLETLTSLEVKMTEEQLGEMVSRQFGDKAVDREVKADDSE